MKKNRIILSLTAFLLAFAAALASERIVLPDVSSGYVEGSCQLQSLGQECNTTSSNPYCTIGMSKTFLTQNGCQTNDTSEWLKRAN